jgi:hypothetical protein
MKLDIWIVRSPDDDSVEEGEYDRAGVEGLSFEESALLPQLPTVHGKDSQEISGTVGAGMSGS